MKIWSNTFTLDGLVGDLTFTTDPTVADVALIGGKAIDLADFPRLRGIFKCGVGRDNVPEAEAAARGIAVGFPSRQTAAIIHDETANFACHLILTGLYAGTGDVATWTKHPRRALAGRTLLVVGTGNIGGRVARKMASFMHVTAYDVATHPEADLDRLIPEADCVTLHVPLTPASRGFWGAARLAAMRPGSLLVNTARAPLVDEAALYDAVTHGRLKAAFDVFWQEPYSGRLTTLPHDSFIATPHIASTCNEFIEGTAADFRAFLQGLTRP
jgi:phosphoglycerate dehydrogenase-like enzyme